MTPIEASLKMNENKVLRKLYPSNANRPIKPKFSAGYGVHIAKKNTVFHKDYTPQWTEKVFIISNIQYTDPPTHIIKDDNSAEIQGIFYEQELQKTTQEIFKYRKLSKQTIINLSSNG